MRRVVFPLFLCPLFMLFSPYSHALANAQVAHTHVADDKITTAHGVSVRLPSVLRLKLSRAEGQQATIYIRAREGVYHLEPDHTVLKVLANGSWQLSARYEPRGAPGAALLWRLSDADAWRPFAPYMETLTSGLPTRGWRRLRVAYGLETPLFGGSYWGVVTYTLTRH